MMLLRQLAPILDLFLVSPCPLCERAGQPLLCFDCQQQLQDCQKSDWKAWEQSQQAIAASPLQEGLQLPLVSWGRYEGQLKRAIAQLKYHNTPALAEPLGEGLAEAWLRSQQSNQAKNRPWVIPVPMHREKQRQRGFNQAELIARSFCRHTGLPLLAQGLRRIQATQAQFELSPAERQRNVAQAFAIGPELLKQRRRQQRPILLLDDIYTTGATVGAIAQLLAAAHIPIAGVVAVAQASSRARPLSQ